MQRIFLDWNTPPLPGLVDRLISDHARNGRLDLRNLVLALPGRRAINRLEELLVEAVEKRVGEDTLVPDWHPPEFLTLGTLPERFYEVGKPLADDLTQSLAWVRVVDEMQGDDPDLLARFLPHPPARGDLDARLDLGRMIARLHRELAAEALDFQRVEEYCRDKKIGGEASRWETLAALQTKYHTLLDSQQVWDLQSARLFAIDLQKTDEYERIVRRFRENETKFLLVGLVDMNRAQKKLLRKFADFVVPVVFAPESFADHFDDFGCLKLHDEKGEPHDFWCDEKIPLDEEQVHVVETPLEQADEVLRRIAELGGRLTADEIVIGVPDPGVVPVLRQRLQQAGIESRHFEGVPMKLTAVYRFLEVLLEFLRRGDFSGLAELVRHPDVESRLRDSGDWPREENRQGGVLDLLSDLDEYHAAFLPEQVDEHWNRLEDEENPWKNRSFDSLRTLWGRLRELLDIELSFSPNEAPRAPVSLWLQKLDATLDRVFATRSGEIVTEALKQLRAAFETLLDAPADLLPQISYAETLRMLLRQLESGNIPPHDKPKAVELIGWLEIVMDDAPFAVVTGMNDGFVPSFMTSDMFLPDRVRRHFQLEDNRRRLARDAYSLQVIRNSRSGVELPGGQRPVQLIGGRRSAEGDPLLPSRLFFMDDDHVVAERVRRFFGELPRKAPLDLGGLIAAPGVNFGFRIPEAEPIGDAITKMSVTEFAAYKECPYRYYLGRRLRLARLHDDDEELGPQAFGNLVHEILKRFGRNEALVDSKSPEAIFAFMEKELADFAWEHYGTKPRPVLEIQLERARSRLEVFAQKQADWREDGYRIEKTEFAFDETEKGGRIHLDVDRRKMFLSGRIDRIDRNERTGELVILDYKTFDTLKKPDAKHRATRNGVREWVDFQLPLYHHILRQAGESGPITLGYFALTRKPQETKVHLAPWDDAELEEALDEARRIVRQIWENDFRPTELPLPYTSDFDVICLEGILKST